MTYSRFLRYCVLTYLSKLTYFCEQPKHRNHFECCDLHVDDGNVADWAPFLLIDVVAALLTETFPVNHRSERRKFINSREFMNSVLETSRSLPLSSLSRFDELSIESIYEDILEKISKNEGKVPNKKDTKKIQILIASLETILRYLRIDAVEEQEAAHVVGMHVHEPQNKFVKRLTFLMIKLTSSPFYNFMNLLSGAIEISFKKYHERPRVIVNNNVTWDDVYSISNPTDSIGTLQYYRNIFYWSYLYQAKKGNNQFFAFIAGLKMIFPFINRSFYIDFWMVYIHLDQFLTPLLPSQTFPWQSIVNVLNDVFGPIRVVIFSLTNMTIQIVKPLASPFVEGEILLVISENNYYVAVHEPLTKNDFLSYGICPTTSDCEFQFTISQSPTSNHTNNVELINDQDDDVNHMASKRKFVDIDDEEFDKGANNIRNIMDPDGSYDFPINGDNCPYDNSFNKIARTTNFFAID